MFRSWRLFLVKLWWKQGDRISPYNPPYKFRFQERTVLFRKVPNISQLENAQISSKAPKTATYIILANSRGCLEPLDTGGFLKTTRTQYDFPIVNPDLPRVSYGTTRVQHLRVRAPCACSNFSGNNIFWCGAAARAPDKDPLFPVRWKEKWR